MDAPAGRQAERAAVEHFAARKAVRHASAVITAMRDALLVVDERGVITDVNAAFCTMTGFGRHQLIGKRKYPFWSRADVAPNSAAIAALLRTTDVGASEVELTLTRASGERCRVTAIIAPLKGRDGETGGYASTLREPDRDRRTTPAEPDQAGLISELAAAIEESSVETAFARIAENAARAIAGNAALIIRSEGGAVTRVGHWAADGVDDLASVVPPNTVNEVFENEGTLTVGGPADAFASVIGLPIRLGGRPWGALYVARATQRGPLRPDAAGVLARFIATATLALIAVDARRPAESHASSDTLTGLDDREAFDDHVAAELDRARRHGRDLSLIVLEVDALDEIGRDIGEDGRDRVLIATAGILRRLVRTGDVIARIRAGGFAWLLPETDGRGAVAAAERARSFIGAISLPAGRFVTISCGIGEADDAGHNPGELFRQSELALHQARMAGGNVTARFGTYETEVAGPSFGGDGRRQTLASLRLVARVMDRSGGQHGRSSEVVADLAEQTALRLGWTGMEARSLHEAALIRDIGLLGIPEEIRAKRDGLTSAERKLLQTHAELGAQLVGQVMNESQASWIRHHHERFDGAGYPNQLRAEQIPEGARIIAVADAWVEMVTELKGRTATAEMIRQLQGEAGWQFCAKTVSALIGVVRDLPHSAPSGYAAETSVAPQEPVASPR